MSKTTSMEKKFAKWKSLFTLLVLFLAAQALAKGIFSFDIVSWLCGGAQTLAAKIVYTISGLSVVVFVLLKTRKHREE